MPAAKVCHLPSTSHNFCWVVMKGIGSKDFIDYYCNHKKFNFFLVEDSEGDEEEKEQEDYPDEDDPAEDEQLATNDENDSGIATGDLRELRPLN